jgi:predicted metalloprotease with PDZ domain
MLIIRPDSLPRFWWLFPWSIARQLHKNAVALQALADRQSEVMRVLREDYTARQRWQIEDNQSEHGVRYYFYDTDPHNWASGVSYTHFRGKAYLYDAESKSFAFETDPAKAILRVNELNAR